MTILSAWLGQKRSDRADGGRDDANHVPVNVAREFKRELGNAEQEYAAA
jgi:hypothetical protein